MNNETQVIQALVKAQTELPLILSKDSKGHLNQYTSYEEVVARVRPILAKHNLILAHSGTLIEGQFYCNTRIIHITGEYIDSLWPIQDQDGQKNISQAQRTGIGWTYAKRYSTLSLLAIGTGEVDLDDQNHQAEVVETEEVNKTETPPTPEEIARFDMKLRTWFRTKDKDQIEEILRFYHDQYGDKYDQWNLNALVEAANKIVSLPDLA